MMWSKYSRRIDPISRSAKLPTKARPVQLACLGYPWYAVGAGETANVRISTAVPECPIDRSRGPFDSAPATHPAPGALVEA